MAHDPATQFRPHLMTGVFSPGFDDLPRELPVFPLTGVLLLPHGRLPLNIFEPRYLSMIGAALGGARMIGMIQPKGVNDGDQPEIYRTGSISPRNWRCATGIAQSFQTGSRIVRICLKKAATASTGTGCYAR